MMVLAELKLRATILPLESYDHYDYAKLDISSH